MVLGLRTRKETGKRSLSLKEAHRRNPWKVHQCKDCGSFIGKSHNCENIWNKMSKTWFKKNHKFWEGVKGENHPGWRGGKTKELDKIRKSMEYREWRRKVLERDNFTCIECGCKEIEQLQVDHIKSFTFYPELRFDINNGRTLCINCHIQTETYGNHKKI